jgi:hypothetical protein
MLTPKWRSPGPHRESNRPLTVTGCTVTESGSELCRLAKLLRRWRAEIVAHHVTGASNGSVDATNLLIKQVSDQAAASGIDNYRLRILLAGGMPPRDTLRVTSIRSRRRRFVA